MPTEITLTEREIAIARGEDPDVIQPAAEVPEVEDAQETVEETSEAVVADEPTEPTWINDDVRDLATSYGMSDDDLQGFTTEEEFRKAGLLLDKQLLDGQAKEEASTTPPTPATEVKEEEEQLIDPQWYVDNDYDEETVKMAKALRRQQELRKEDRQTIEDLKTWRQNFETSVQEQEVQRRTIDFHETADKLDEKLFGKAYDDRGLVQKLDQKHDENRAKLWEAMQTLEAGIIARAQTKGVAPALPPWSVLMQRAHQIAFPETITARKRDQRIEDATKQSAKRRPVGTQGAARPNRVTDTNDPVSIANSPEILDWWKKNVTS